MVVVKVEDEDEGKEENTMAKLMTVGVCDCNIGRW